MGLHLTVGDQSAWRVEAHPSLEQQLPHAAASDLVLREAIQVVEP